MARKPSQTRAELAILHLAKGETIAGTARACGCSVRSIYRLFEQDPGFSKRIDDARAEALTQATGILSCAAIEAAQTLRKLLKSRSDNIKLAAAKGILEVGTRLRELVAIEKRLGEIEEKLARAQQLKNGDHEKRGPNCAA